MAFSIITDTSANLPTELVLKYDITVTPFSFFLEGQEYTCTDSESFDGPGFYNAMRGGAIVTTSQVNPQRHMDYMEPLLAQGKDILYVGMSSGISGAYSCSEIAATGLAEKSPERKIRLIDPLGASLGEGLLALRAAVCREEGMGLDETADFLLGLRDRFYQVFTVDNLTYLQRSGRISNATALIGTVLQIKPLLKGNEEGKIVTFGKVRGRKQSIRALAEKYDSLVKDPACQMVGIAHADCPEDAAYLAALLNENAPPKEILTVCYEPVTGSHVGPGTLALFFEGEEGVRLQ